MRKKEEPAEGESGESGEAQGEQKGGRKREWRKGEKETGRGRERGIRSTSFDVVAAGTSLSASLSLSLSPSILLGIAAATFFFISLLLRRFLGLSRRGPPWTSPRRSIPLSASLLAAFLRRSLLPRLRC